MKGGVFMSLLFKCNDRVLSGRFAGAKLMRNLYDGKYSFANCIICRENIRFFQGVKKIHSRYHEYYIVRIVWRDDTESICQFVDSTFPEILGIVSGTAAEPTPHELFKYGMKSALKELF